MKVPQRGDLVVVSRILTEEVPAPAMEITLPMLEVLDLDPDQGFWTVTIRRLGKESQVFKVKIYETADGKWFLVGLKPTDQ
jgi:hypothetical protein